MIITSKVAWNSMLIRPTSSNPMGLQLPPETMVSLGLQAPSEVGCLGWVPASRVQSYRTDLEVPLEPKRVAVRCQGKTNQHRAVVRPWALATHRRKQLPTPGKMNIPDATNGTAIYMPLYTLGWFGKFGGSMGRHSCRHIWHRWSVWAWNLKIFEYGTV